MRSTVAGGTARTMPSAWIASRLSTASPRRISAVKRDPSVRPVTPERGARQVKAGLLPGLKKNLPLCNLIWPFSPELASNVKNRLAGKAATPFCAEAVSQQIG
jgi:hypothetical protein